MNATAQQVAQTPFQQYSTDPNAFVAPLTAEQNAGISGVNQYANSAQPAIQGGEALTMAGAGAANPTQLNQSAINQYMNPYMNDVVQQESNLLNQQNQTAQSGQLGTAIQSGAFGGDRAGVAAANLAGQQELAYGNTMAPILQQGYNTALSTAQQQQGVDLSAQQANLARLSSAGAQLGSLGQAGQSAGLAGAQAQMAAGQTQQQTQQAGLTALYNQFLQQQSYPFQTTQFLANIAEGTGALSGQTTNTTQPSSFFSDRRLKENIKEVGKGKNGLPIYSFNYKSDPDKVTRLGYMADEVEKKHPEAVGLAGGYKTVDYEKASRPKRFAGGLLADSAGGSVTDEDQGGLYARGGYDVGGSPGWDALVASHGALYGNDSAAGGLDRTAAGLPGKGRAGIPQQASQHQMLQPAHMPTQQQTGLQQVGGLLSNAENGYKDLKSAQGAWGDAQKGLQGLTGGAPAAAPTVTAAAPPPADASTPTPADGDALARGGLIHRDSGGQTDGGDPENLYQSAGGLDIPNQSSNYHLPNTTSSNSGGSSGSGLSSALGLVKDASAIPGVVSGLSSLGSSAASGLAGFLPFLTLERGGRAQSAVPEGCDFARGGLADGGDPMADSSGVDPNSDPDVPFTYAPLEQDVAHPGKFVTDAAPGETQLINREAGLAPKGTPESWAHGVDISGDQKPDPGLVPTGTAPVAAGEENAPALPTGENIPLPPTRPAGLGAAAAPAVPAASDDTTALNRAAAAGDTAADPANYGPGPVGGLAPPATGQQAIAQATPEYAGNLRIAPEVSALWPRQIGQESGGHQFGKDGRPLTSPTGAVGIAQVEPGTAPEAAALAGVPFDENRYHNDPAYNELLGKAYMQAQFEKYGDINKALAAYNAGPGAVDNAIRKGGGSWLGYLPPETQNYVASINGGGAPAGGVAGAFGNVKSSLGGLGAAAQNGTSGLAHFAQNVGQDVTKGGQEASDWVNTNQNWMIPLLTGLGTMASSNSRYLGSAVLQGLGGGAQAYAKQQADQAAIAHQRAQTGLTSSEAARVNAGTTSQLMENFKNLSYKDPATGQPMIMVAGPNGQPQAMTRQEYLEKGESYRGLDPSTAFAAGRAGNTQSPAPVYGTPAPAQLPGAGGAAGAAAPVGGATAPNAPHLGAPVHPTAAPLGVHISPQTLAAAKNDDRYDVNNQAAVKQGDEEVARIQSDASAARDTGQATQKTAATVADAVAKQRGLGVTGYGATTRADLTNLFNTSARLFGHSEAVVDGSEDQTALLYKLGIVRAAAAAKSGGQQAYAALDQLNTANPETTMPPKVMATLAAQIWADQQRAKDKADYLPLYKGSGATGAAQVSKYFDTDMGPEKYNAERAQLEKMILTQPTRMHALMAGKANSAQTQQALQAWGYSPELARYFVSGGQ